MVNITLSCPVAQVNKDRSAPSSNDGIAIWISNYQFGHTSASYRTYNSINKGLRLSSPPRTQNSQQLTKLLSNPLNSPGKGNPKEGPPPVGRIHPQTDAEQLYLQETPLVFSVQGASAAKKKNIKLTTTNQAPTLPNTPYYPTKDNRKTAHHQSEEPKPQNWSRMSRAEATTPLNHNQQASPPTKLSGQPLTSSQTSSFLLIVILTGVSHYVHENFLV